MKLFDTIGNTPMVELTSPNPPVRLFAKLEGNNPAGSVKDRPAFNMIKAALDRGDIKPGEQIVEATSGNTGIALAMAAGQLGVKMLLIMPDNATPERVKTMKAYGAEIELTPAAKTIEYSRQRALDLSKDMGYRILNQFDNPDNWKAHYKSTGPELWRDSQGAITHFVSAMGTTGTIMGTSRFLKEQNSKIQIVGAQPTEGDSIPGIRRWSPEYLPKIFEPSRVDRIEEVSREAAEAAARRLAKEGGVMAGVSSGGAYHIATNLARELQEGFIVFIACDRGDRYLSGDLY